MVSAGCLLQKPLFETSGRNEFWKVDRISCFWVHPAGQWWFKRGLFLEKGEALGGHVCDGWEGCVKEIGFADPYRMAVHNILNGSLSASGYKGVTVLRTFAPDHFEDGRWDTGGKCTRTSPGGVPVSFLTEWMYGIQKEQFANVTGMYIVKPPSTPFFFSFWCG